VKTSPSSTSKADASTLEIWAVLVAPVVVVLPVVDTAAVATKVVLLFRPVNSLVKMDQDFMSGC
jgi:hypothetical protein